MINNKFQIPNPKYQINSLSPILLGERVRVRGRKSRTIKRLPPHLNLLRFAQDKFLPPSGGEEIIKTVLFIIWCLGFGISNCYAGSDYLDYLAKMRGHFGVKTEDVLVKGQSLFAGGDIDDIGASVKTCIEKEGFYDDNTTVGMELQEAFLDDKRYKQATEAAAVYIYSRMDERTNFSTEFKSSQPQIYHLKDTPDAAIKRYTGNNRTNTLLFKCENSPVDNQDYPASGRKTDLSFEVSSEQLGSDFDFLRTRAENAFYFTPTRCKHRVGGILNRVTFVLIQKGGWIRKFGGEDELPFFERFYAGGTGTVRGYKPRYLSPRDTDGLPIGGNAMAVLTAELRYPVYKDINGAVFYDQGNVWKSSRDIDLTDMKAAVGTGLRWITRFGALRLDYGYGLNSGSRQRGGRAHISLGMKF